MSKINVAVGQQIEPGTVIGNVGSTGRSTGPHVHFEIDANGQSKVDPTSYADKIFRFGGNVRVKPNTQANVQSNTPTAQASQQSQTSTSITPQVQQTSTVSPVPQKPTTSTLPLPIVQPAPAQQKIEPQQYQYYPSYSESQALIIDRPMLITGNTEQNKMMVNGGGGQSMMLLIPPEGQIVNSIMKTILLTNLSSA